jgi:hypothetical protein
MRRRGLAVAIAAGVAIVVYVAYQQANRSPYALEIDAIRDVTDVGVQYRIRMRTLLNLRVIFNPC